MSLCGDREGRHDEEVVCECGQRFNAKVWHLVDLGQNPELRETILEGKLNVVECPKCKTQRTFVDPTRRGVSIIPDPEKDIVVEAFPKESEHDWKAEDDLLLQETIDRIRLACGLTGQRRELWVTFGIDDLRAVLIADRFEPIPGVDMPLMIKCQLEAGLSEEELEDIFKALRVLYERGELFKDEVPEGPGPRKDDAADERGFKGPRRIVIASD